MQLTIRTHTDIREIPEATWDEVGCPERSVSTHRFLRAVQDARVNDCRFFYPTVFHGDRLVAHACMYLIESKLDMFGSGPCAAVVATLGRLIPALTRFRSLECGSPVALGTTVSVLPGVDASPVLRALAGESIRLARAHRADGVLFRDFLDDDLPLFSILGQHGFRLVPNLPSATLDVRWRSEEEYVDALRHPYRRAYRQRRRLLAEGGVRARIVTDFAPLATELAALWRQTYDRAREYRREVLGPEFFRRVSQELATDSTVLLLEKDGACLAFALLLAEGRRLVWPCCGLDYARNRRYELYFNLLHEIILHACRLGAAEVEMGVTTLDAKKRVGARARPLHMYMRHGNPCLRGFAPWLFRQLAPADRAPDHRVFRPGSREAE